MTPPILVLNHLLTNNLSLDGRFSTLDPLRLRAIDMAVRNPALVICFLSQRTSRNSRSISTNDRNLILGRNRSLTSTRRTLGALTTLASALGLWEQGLYPGLVDEVESSSEYTGDDEVEKDAVQMILVLGE
jgi:hypothetical protein